MKNRITTLMVMAIFGAASILTLVGCGSSTGQNLEEYMKDQTSLRVSTDAELNMLSADTKASVQYTEDNKAEVTVQYYALTDEEIKAIEPDKAKVRCNAILKPVLEQFTEDTGNKAEVVVIIEGHTED